MAYGASASRRTLGAALAAVVEVGLAALVFWGLAAQWSKPPARAPSLVTITPSQPPAPPPAPATDGGARAEATPRQAPAPQALPSPQIVLASPSPIPPGPPSGDAVGADAGSGKGTGSGSGVGSGAGNAVGPAVRTSGELRDRDYPDGLRSGGTVAIAFRVLPNGRVDGCAIVASSGEPVLDQLTCRLVTKRFRYRPARNASGEPMESTVRTSFTWGTRQRS